jgi:hypothetical protein
MYEGGPATGLRRLVGRSEASERRRRPTPSQLEGAEQL